jgi:peptidoglycan/LPS O-acetylase OafA/YrhL
LAIWLVANGSVPAQQFVYFSTVTRIDCIIAGAIVAIALHNGFELRQSWISNLVFVFCIIGIVAIVAIDPRHSFWDNWFMGTFGLSFTAGVGVGLLLYGLRSPCSLGGRFLRSKALSTIGRYSYALYVFHWPVILLTNYFFSYWRVRDVTFMIVFPIISAGITFGLALLSWNLIEKKCLALKGKFEHLSPTSIPA